MALERLQKIIAAAGIASRRKAEELIQSGLVTVNGTTVTELGTKADPETDSIRVNNKLLKGPERHEYLALNKPRGYVTTVSDPEGRPTVMEFVRTKARLYPIGRLDFNSEGLLLLTNDGDLAHKLMKAASHIPKTYLVKVAGQPDEEQLRRLRAGVTIAEERDPKRRVRTAPAQIRLIKEAENPWLEVTLHEGRNRQIRKMFEQIGHHVEKIRRVRYGPLELDLPPGESRPLSQQEVLRLKRATEAPPKSDFRTGGERQGDKRGRPERRFDKRERSERAAHFDRDNREQRFATRKEWTPKRPTGRFRDREPREWNRTEETSRRFFTKDFGARAPRSPQDRGGNRRWDRSSPPSREGNRDETKRSRDEEQNAFARGKASDRKARKQRGFGRPRPGS